MGTDLVNHKPGEVPVHVNSRPEDQTVSSSKWFDRPVRIDKKRGPQDLMDVTGCSDWVHQPHRWDT